MHDETLRTLTATHYALILMSLLEAMLRYPRFIMLVATGFRVLFAADSGAPIRHATSSPRFR